MRTGFARLLLPLLLLWSGTAQAQKVESGFTVWTDLDDLQWSPTPGRKALLVGNGAYTDDPQNRPIGALGNLGTPCDDARMVAASLVAAGWKREEIAVACNQTAERLDRALGRLINVLPRTDGDKPLTFIYLAGHGAQTDQRNYFFGVKAPPDMGRAIDQVLNGDGGELFGGSATNVVATFANQLGNRSPSPILLVLDACRDDTLFEQVRSHLMDKARNTPNVDMRAIASEARGFLTAPQGIVQPHGIRILYASSQGARVLDDNGRDGHSWLAVALDDAIRRFAKAESVVGAAADEVGQNTGGLAVERRQFPDATGFFRGDPCIGRCPLNNATPLPLGMKASLLKFASLITAPPSVPYRQARNNGQSISLLSSDTTDPKKATLEIFWCADVPQEDRNEKAAMALGRAVENRVRSGRADLANLVRLRVTPLSLADNAEPDRQVNQDLIVLDPSADAYGSSLRAIDTGLELSELKSAGPRYVAVYYCKGSYRGPVAPTVYVQSPSGGLDASTAIIKRLFKFLPAFNTINFVDTKPPFYPSRTEVRYFDPRQKAAAIAVAKEVEKSTGIRPRLNSGSAPLTPDDANLVEVWLSKKDAPNASDFVRAEAAKARGSVSR